jgi:hypothetical protein
VTLRTLLTDVNFANSYTPPAATANAEGVFRYTARMLAGVCEGEAVAVGVKDDVGVMGASFQ